jgi:hypothetical protein
MVTHLPQGCMGDYPLSTASGAIRRPMLWNGTLWHELFIHVLAHTLIAGLHCVRKPTPIEQYHMDARSTCPLPDTPANA